MVFIVPTEKAKLRQFVVTVLRRFRQIGLTKGHRGVPFAYMQRLTGYSRQHLTRLVAQYRDTNSLRLRNRAEQEGADSRVLSGGRSRPGFGRNPGAIGSKISEVTAEFSLK